MMRASLPVSTVGVTFERDNALLDAKWMIDERGMSIVYYKREENNDIERGKYNSIKRRSSVVATANMKAFPVQWNPMEEEILKAGLRERVDLLIYTAMLDWTNNDLDPENDISHVRDTIVLKGKSYSIKDLGFVNHFYDTYLNVTFGLVLR
jgi:hypothetical protein